MRRPKLIPGNLYLIKDKSTWEPYLNKYVPIEFIGLLKEKDTTANLYIKLGIPHLHKGHPYETYMDFEVQASPFQGKLPGTIHRMFDDATRKKCPRPTLVIQKFNRKNLPLYMGWEFGNDWILKQLKEA